MTMNKVLVSVIVVLLLLINWLTFHDFLEPHSVRDWLLLVASVFVFFYLGKEYLKKV